MQEWKLSSIIRINTGLTLNICTLNICTYLLINSMAVFFCLKKAVPF